MSLVADYGCSRSLDEQEVFVVFFVGLLRTHEILANATKSDIRIEHPKDARSSVSGSRTKFPG